LADERLQSAAHRSIEVVPTADEVVIVDTGSTDASMQIARAHRPRLYEHPWNASFSEVHLTDGRLE
jgi:glycosyltransferase involved in cell wall biosynthesis